VRQEVVGVCAAEHDHAHALVGLEQVAQPKQLGHERGVEQVERRMIEGDPGDVALDRDRQAREVRRAGRLHDA
jgi:hypothetical protein